MQHLFAPDTIALQLKEKGFDEPCFGLYHKEKGFVYPKADFISKRSIASIVHVLAPLYQQVIDFVNSKGFSLQYGNISLSLLDKQILECLNKLESIK